MRCFEALLDNGKEPVILSSRYIVNGMATKLSPSPSRIDDNNSNDDHYDNDNDHCR